MDAETEIRRGLANRRVLVTGHTGFKGAWLCLLLEHLGAEVTGLALAPDDPCLFTDARLAGTLGAAHRVGDIRDPAAAEAAFRASLSLAHRSQTGSVYVREGLLQD